MADFNNVPIKNSEKQNEIKSQLLISLGKVIVFIIVGVLVLAVITYIVKKEDGSFKEGDWSNTGYAVNQMVLSSTTVENIAPDEDEEYTLGIDLDLKATEIIQKLEDENGDLDKYLKDKDDKTVKDYLKAFIKAELITQYPDLRSLEKIQNRACNR